jgi:hypothetical protein
MTDVIPARMTHDYDGDLVVFLIGMRINRPWRPDLWLPVFSAMPAMLAELSKDKDSGLLGYRLTLGAGGPLLVQYWNSHESSTTMQATATRPIAQHGPRSTAERGRFRVRSGSGTRPMWSSGPSPSTHTCLFRAWPRPQLPCRWRDGVIGRRSGSACDRLPKVGAPSTGSRRSYDSREKWSGRRLTRR